MHHYVHGWQPRGWRHTDLLSGAGTREHRCVPKPAQLCRAARAHAPTR